MARRLSRSASPYEETEFIDPELAVKSQAVQESSHQAPPAPVLQQIPPLEGHQYPAVIDPQLLTLQHSQTRSPRRALPLSRPADLRKAKFVADITPEDMYSPRYTRGGGTKKEAWCGLCPVGDWYNLRSSRYGHHMTFTHGVSPVTCRPYDPPVEVVTVSVAIPPRRNRSSVPAFRMVPFGRHGACNELVDLRGKAKPNEPEIEGRRRQALYAWVRHCRDCIQSGVSSRGRRGRRRRLGEETNAAQEADSEDTQAKEANGKEADPKEVDSKEAKPSVNKETVESSADQV